MALCKKCGRKLTSKLSSQRGYGPSCYKKVMNETENETDIKIDEKDLINTTKSVLDRNQLSISDLKELEVI